jgi:nucleoporin GLE1
LGIGGLLNQPPQPNGVASTSAATRSSAPLPAPPPAQQPPDRYTEIHKNLKALRKSMAEQAKTNAALKARMGDMRREIRKSVGQLTVSSGVAGVNKTQVRNHDLLLPEDIADLI